MRRPPPWTDIIKYPVAGGTIGLALAATLAWWSGKVDISPLLETVDIRRGQVWRMLTSVLPHATILHLVFNIYWTWTFGTLVERVFGDVRTLGIFVLLAVVANGSEFAVLSGGVGLSGIGYGLFGLVWMLSRRDARFTDAMDQNTVYLFVGWFFFCIALTLGGMPIANVAHGVGAVAGMLLGLAISAPRQKRQAAIAGLALLVVGVMVGSTVARPWINMSSNRGGEEFYAGYQALKMDRNAEALSWLKDTTIMRPKDAAAWFDMGLAYDRLNRHDEAVKAYQRAHELEPGDASYEAAAGK